MNDINALMRIGHPFIREAEERCVELVAKHARRKSQAGSVRLFEIGCATGLLTEKLADSVPNLSIVAGEELADVASVARDRLAQRGIEVYSRPLAEWRGTVDILLSAGSHHHLEPGYLAHAHRMLDADGVFILADELCPEYCVGKDAERIAGATVIEVVDGYVLTTEQEVADYRRDGRLPPHAIDRERLRKRALWNWYRFVVDHAIALDAIEVAVAELQSAHDDLITGSAAEHKMAPSIVERELQLAGFRISAKHALGPADDPGRQSIFVYELAKQA